MAGINSRRSLLGLFALSALCCGAILLASRLRLQTAATPPADLVWERPSSGQEVTFSKDGRIVSIADYNICKTFDSKTGRLLSSWTNKGLGKLSPDGRYLLQIDTGRPMQTVKVGLRSSSRKLWIGRAINCHDAATGRLIWRFPLPDETSTIEYYSPEILEATTTQVLVRSDKRLKLNEGLVQHTVRRLSLRDGKLLESFTPPVGIGRYWGTTWALKNDGTPVFQTGGSVERKEPLNLSGKNYHQNFDLPADDRFTRHFFPLSFDRKEQFLAGVRSNGRNSYVESSDIGRLFLWSTKGKLLWTARPDNFSANALQFSPDNRFVAMGGTNWYGGANAIDSSVYVYEVASGRLVKELTQSTWVNKTSLPINLVTRPPRAVHSGSVSALAWSPDSRRLAVTYERVIRVWQVR
ncbi:hypothetical protein EON80_00495 [bacterium]|nr:MAG: hypothetical protein EON80_00495 [bacterium]